MAAAAPAEHFGPLEAERAVRAGDDRAGQGTPEARPAGAAVELRLGRKDREAAAGAGEDALAMLAEQRARAGRLGRRAAQHRVTLRAEHPAPRVGIMIDLETR